MDSVAIFNPPLDMRPTAPTPKGPPWTREQASMYGKMGAGVQRRNRARLKQELAAQAPNPYAAWLLGRVRKHLSKVCSELDRATDTADIDRLTRALERLAETERKLAGRPAPGTTRPTTTKQSDAPISAD